ncbi:tetratricopeptide repeat protein [Staphylococcus simiae]|uniref:TPR domain-containing protein n=1 Tax=Staphylococcus simiae CCM 7213 = CCUG 51256 TaxID=911238 RepID=G5JG48_9STAP|nr:tetratricopeptide repeat protein [Staphylococcus simiae]EHJ08847.1 TPR domain-containing protein [Staphylococcus simiae CCM 7213 = CCUG 51256]PNZ14404.1 tetratricopeptide repeat protein [Staphylococcus simiae]SNV73716.1 tetratricopeptide repeat family protein [Staphylococcus simiae]
MIEQQTIYQYIQQGKIEQALQALFDNIEEEPNTVENYINAGIVLADANEIDKAERFFQKALTLDANNGVIYYNLANLYYNQQRYQDAIKLYQQALETKIEQVDCNYMIGMSFNQLEAFKQALPYFMTAAELDQQDDTEIQFQYGLILCRLEMFDQAIQQLQHVLTIDSEHVDALYNLGLATYMKNENIEEAITYFQRAVDIDPQHLLSQHALKTFTMALEEE